jgi:outer membrane protein OmpA-like peptidoglycan-associated protein
MRAKVMRFSSAVFLASVLALPSGLAWGAVQTGDEVTVNPLPTSSGSTTLLYPGGQYMRVVRPLLQPGQNSKDSGPILLHMPGKSAARASAPAPRITAAPQPARRVASAPKPAPAPPQPKRVASAPAPSPSQNNGYNHNGYNPAYGALGAPTDSAVGLSAPEPPAPTPPKRVAKAEPMPATRAPMAEEPPIPGLTKRSVILFAAGASDPAQSALGSIKFLAGDLNASMVGAGSRIQLLAYGGDKGDKGSDARRLSLKRALAIRQVLIDDGVPSERIDVRAMGGADDGGPSDRVDVFVKT